MIRTPLNQGDNLQLNSRQYTIEKVIGDGSTCIVYSAYYSDSMGHSHYVNIKECYPYNANIVRNGQMIIWNSSEEKAQCLDVFRDTYEKLMTWQNENSTVSVFDICKANNTLYIIMNADKGVTFDKDATASLHDILKTIKLLTHFVGVYHANGYLHLDLKPSNFLVYPRPSDHIVLFDIDTVTSIEDIRAGNVKGISYSDSWAAPEQKQGKISKLCPATDIFSIGAILFEKVMGRSVEAADMGVFADWNFESERFENVNPKIKRLLRNIFKKTLSANIKRRYQSTGELREALVEAIDTITAPFLRSDYPANIGRFVGRERELESIANAFASGERLLVLKGIGGIGKSELAKQYAFLHENDYDAVIFCPYEGSLADTLDKIEIQSFDGSLNEHQKQLRMLLDKHVLLVIDGFDVDDTNDLGILEKLKCDLLITSRLDWKEYSLPTIEIGPMSEAGQFCLFLNAFDKTLDINQQRTVLEILKSIEGYTLLIPLIAKQLRKGVSGFEEVLSKLRFAGIKEASVVKVRHLKDGVRMFGTVYGILSTVLNMADFSEDEEYIMRSLALLSRYRIDQNAFISWVGQEHLEQIDDLVFAGWVLREQQGSVTLSLHPVIADLCYEELKPSLANCNGIANHFCMLATEVKGYPLETDNVEFAAIEEKAKQLLSFLRNIDYTVIENLIYGIEVLYNILDSNIENANAFGGDSLTFIVKQMSALLPHLGQFIGDIYLFKANNLIETIWCSDKQPLYDDEKPGSEDSGYGIYVDELLRTLLCTDGWDAESCKSQFIEAIKVAQSMPDNFRAEAIYRVFYPALQCMEQYLEYWAHDSESRYNFACVIKENCDIIRKEFVNFEREVDIAWIEKCLNDIFEYLAYWDYINDAEITNPDDDDEDWTLSGPQNAFEEWSDAILFYPTPKQANELLRDNRLNDLEKAHLLALCNPFSSWYHKSKDSNAKKWLKECYWQYFDELLYVQTKLLWNSIDEWTDDDERLFGYVSVNRAIVWAVLGCDEPFKVQVEVLLNRYISDTKTNELGTLLSPWSLEQSLLGYTINALRCIYKTHWILPCVLNYMTYLKERVSSTDVYSESDLLDFYKYVYKIADEANQEVGADTDVYTDLLNELRASITSITGVNDVLFPK